MKKNKKRVVVGIIVIVIISFIILMAGIINTDTKYADNECSKKSNYRNGEKCYYYDGKSLYLYELEEQDGDNEGIELKYSCDVQKCDEKIIEVTKDYLIIEKDGLIEKFDNENAEIKDIENNSLKGMFFTNETEELYFLNDEIIIISDKDYNQAKETYQISNYIGKYLNIEVPENSFLPKYPSNLIYNVEKNEILGYKKSNINQSLYIDKDTYDENGEVKMKPEYYLNGAYKNEDYELFVVNNKAIIATEEESKMKIYKINLSVEKVSKKYIYYVAYDEKEDNWIGDFIFKRENKKLCFDEKEDCHSSIDISEFKLLKTENIK